MTILLLAISLLDLEKIALENNAGYQQAALQVAVAEGDRRQAGLYPNPYIGFNSEHNSPDPSVRWGSNGGVLGQRIVLGGKLGIEKALADREIDEARARRDWAKWELLGHVRMLYYQALGEQELIAAREQLAATSRETADFFTQLRNTGLADEPDVLSAGVEADRAAVRLDQARQALRRTFRQLSALVQQEVPEQPLTGEFLKLPLLERDQVWENITRESPELVLPEIATRRAALAVKQARAARIPDIQARGGVRYNREIGEITRRPIGPEGIFDVGIELPLFNRQQGAIAAAKARQQQAALEPARVRRTLESRFAEVWREYEQAGTAARRYGETMVPATRQALEMNRRNYRAMAAPYATILASQRSLSTLQEEYVESLQAAWRAVAAIESVLAVDTGTH